MFGLFAKKRQGKRNLVRARALHGMVVRYVTERRDGEELVLGRGGSVSVRDGMLLVLSSKEIVFRSVCAETEISDLMSGDGVILHGRNLERDGEEQSITVFFVDYIK